MDNKVYLWLFNNLNKYTFKGENANRLKAEIGGLLITESTIDTAEISEKMSHLYNEFTENFYNNVYGYRNGLENKSILSAELDCYFVQTPSGLVPIGYYKVLYPVEAVVLVQNYLDECYNSVKDEVNGIVLGWQTKKDEITEKYKEIPKKNHPSNGRLKAGYIFLCISAFVFIIYAIAMGLFMSIDVGVIVGLIVSVFVSALEFCPFIIPLLIFTLAERKMVSLKKDTLEIKDNMLSVVTQVEQDVENDIGLTEEITNCVRGGRNFHLVRSSCVEVIGKTNRKIHNALAYGDKAMKKRSRVRGVFFVITMGIAGFFDLCAFLISLIVLLAGM